MVWFDDEHQLEQSIIGESLLAMIKDEPIGFEGPARHVVKDAMEDPFPVVRERLATINEALNALAIYILFPYTFPTLYP